MVGVVVVVGVVPPLAQDFRDVMLSNWTGSFWHFESW